MLRALYCSTLTPACLSVGRLEVAVPQLHPAGAQAGVGVWEPGVWVGVGRGELGAWSGGGLVGVESRWVKLGQVEPGQSD